MWPLTLELFNFSQSLKGRNALCFTHFLLFYTYGVYTDWNCTRALDICHVFMDIRWLDYGDDDDDDGYASQFIPGILNTPPAGCMWPSIALSMAHKDLLGLAKN